jgi:hypothetical protein
VGSSSSCNWEDAVVVSEDGDCYCTALPVLTSSYEPKKSMLVGKLGDSRSALGLGTVGGVVSGSSTAILSSSSTHNAPAVTNVVELDEWCMAGRSMP